MRIWKMSLSVLYRGHVQHGFSTTLHSSGDTCTTRHRHCEHPRQGRTTTTEREHPDGGGGGFRLLETPKVNALPAKGGVTV